MPNEVQSCAGFLLSSRCIADDKSTTLEYWFATEQGPIQCRIEQPSVCFILQVDSDRVQRLAQASVIDLQVKPVELQNFKQQAVAACYLAQAQIYDLQKLLNDWDIPSWEVDIRAQDRYLMERSIRGGALIEHQGNKTRLKALNYQPQLSMLSIDIETSFPKQDQPDRLFSIAYYGEIKQQPVQKVLMISPEPLPESEGISYFVDEISLLRAFLIEMQQLDPDVIVGWNFIQFDMLFLRKKFDQHELAFTLGRDSQEIIWRQDRNKPDRYYIHVPGRSVIDGIELLRQAEYQFESFALDNVADILLGRGKLLHGPDRGGDIEHLFVADKLALADYNLEDCKLVWDIFEKTDLLNFAIQRSQITGLLLDRMGGSVAGFENHYLPKLHRAGYVAPNMQEGYDGVKSLGGYVMDSIPGFYQSVLVLDFKSLYPSIIRTFKIDPMGLIEGLACEDMQQTIEGFNGGVYHREKHELPNLVEQLWLQRDKAKTENNQPLSKAIKIIMSSFYGVLGSPGCRFFDVRLSSSITERSHQIIQQTSDWIEAQGYQVIYGDTDSVFVSLGESCTQQQADEIGHSLKNQLNSYWQARLKDELNLESFLEIEYETHYQRFFMPSIRGQEKGSKKRYAGLVFADCDQDQSEVIFKGLEAVRTDWTLLARQFQQEFFHLIFSDQDYHQWMKDYVEKLFSGEFDHLLTYRKRLRRPIGDYQKNIPPHAQAAKKLEAWRAHNNMLPLYDVSGGWVSYRMTMNGAEPIENQTAALDYHYYFERQLMPIADSVLMFFNESFIDNCGQQQSLF